MSYGSIPARSKGGEGAPKEIRIPIGLACRAQVHALRFTPQIHSMLSTRFVALVVASIAASASAAALEASAPIVHSTSIASPELEAGSLKGCQTHDYKDACDDIAFTENGCTNLPSRQLNNLDSVVVPLGWICTFYDGSSGCDEAASVATTTLTAPGSTNLVKQNFGDRADAFKCVLR
ncbi:hypothetical protein DFH06DRAFT_1331829 [Mycena polygramma]|nr:hypothetical protein DFH06DRAFT_1331829 [Mycena polygramma]